MPLKTHTLRTNLITYQTTSIRSRITNVRSYSPHTVGSGVGGAPTGNLAGGANGIGAGVGSTIGSGAAPTKKAPSKHIVWYREVSAFLRARDVSSSRLIESAFRFAFLRIYTC
jgi:hypothetical protein